MHIYAYICIYTHIYKYVYISIHIHSFATIGHDYVIPTARQLLHTYTPFFVGFCCCCLRGHQYCIVKLIRLSMLPLVI